MLQCALETHAALEKPKDREWIHVLLSFLATYALSSGADMLVKEDDKVAYISNLVDALKQSASELDTGWVSRSFFTLVLLNLLI